MVYINMLTKFVTVLPGRWLTRSFFFGKSNIVIAGHSERLATSRRLQTMLPKSPKAASPESTNYDQEMVDDYDSIMGRIEGQYLHNQAMSPKSPMDLYVSTYDDDNDDHDESNLVTSSSTYVSSHTWEQLEVSEALTIDDIYDISDTHHEDFDPCTDTDDEIKMHRKHTCWSENVHVVL